MQDFALFTLIMGSVLVIKTLNHKRIGNSLTLLKEYLNITVTDGFVSICVNIQNLPIIFYRRINQFHQVCLTDTGKHSSCRAERGRTLIG